MKSYNQTHNNTHIYTHTLHPLKLSQCRVGAESLSKRTRSLGANVTWGPGVGGYKGFFGGYISVWVCKHMIKKARLFDLT